MTRGIETEGHAETKLETIRDGGLRIVFALLHAGYLRHFGPPIRLLAARGHSIHLALLRDDPKDKGDALLLEKLLADCPSVTAARAPKRGRADGWRALAWLVRGLVDVLRYTDPRFAEAPALKRRATAKIVMRVESSRADPISRRIVLRAIEWLVREHDPRRIRRILRALEVVENAIPSSRSVERLLRSYRADVVVASPVVEFASPQVEFVKSAQHLGIPAAVSVASWDNLTNKGLLRVVPDRVFVWNDIQRAELEEMHSVPKERVVITGGQKFDAWFDRVPSLSREEFAGAVSLDPRRRYVLYLCSSPFVAPDEVAFVRRWIETLRASGHRSVRDLGILIRPHPQNAAPWASADLSAYENVAVWPREGEYPDEGDAQAAFFDSLAHSVAVVGVNTTAQIEAGVVGKPVYTVEDGTFAETQVGTLHFHYLLHENGGFVHAAKSLEEHVDQLAAGISDPTASADHIRRFIETFVRPHGLDRPVTPIVAEQIEAFATARRSSGRRVGSTALALRAVLLPVVAATSLCRTAVAAARIGSTFVRRRRRGAGQPRPAQAERLASD
jgi:hypothetical protein